MNNNSIHSNELDAREDILLLLQVQVSEIILTMALLEIDSFVLKFKNLLHLEKDARLTLKSEAGRAVVTTFVTTYSK